MDINALLPLLLKNGAMGEKEKMLMGMLQNKDKQPDLPQILSMLNKTRPKSNAFNIVKLIVPSDILGKILKHVSKKGI